MKETSKIKITLSLITLLFPELEGNMLILDKITKKIALRNDFTIIYVALNLKLLK